MDAFFASVEQRDHEELRGVPVAVGYGESRGVVSAASYEARQYGVHSAMPALTAKHKCPQLVFVPPRFEVYQAVSQQIRSIFLDYTDLVEPLSLDEAFLDVTTNHVKQPSATLLAKEIQKRIWDETQLSASAGVSYNKFLAKIASDYRKPKGLFVIRPEEGEAFVEQLDIKKFFGVGKVTLKKMYQHGIYTGRELKQFTELDLVKRFGKVGHQFYLYARGIDHREVVAERITKSLSTETTFLEDKSDRMLLQLELYQLAKEVMERVKEENFQGRTVQLKLKYANFQVITRSKTCPQAITNFSVLWEYAKELLQQVDLSSQACRLIGLGISNPTASEWVHNPQLRLNLPF